MEQRDLLATPPLVQPRMWLTCGCRCMLTGHVQFFLHQNLLVILCRATFNKFFQSVLISGIALALMQRLSLGLVEPHEVLVG